MFLQHYMPQKNSRQKRELISILLKTDWISHKQKPSDFDQTMPQQAAI